MASTDTEKLRLHLQSPSSVVKRRKLNMSEEVILIVGKEKQRFTAHKDFLTKTSGFFQACCRGHWKVAQEKEISLPEISPYVFSNYLRWCYSREVATSVQIRSQEKGEGDDEAWSVQDFRPLIQLAIQADVLQDLSHSHAIIDAFVSTACKTKRILRVDDLNLVNDNLPKSSGLYRFVVDVIAGAITPESCIESMLIEAPGIVYEVMLALVKDRRDNERREAPSWAERSVYYDHSEQTTGGD